MTSPSCMQFEKLSICDDSSHWTGAIARGLPGIPGLGKVCGAACVLSAPAGRHFYSRSCYLLVDTTDLEADIKAIKV